MPMPKARWSRSQNQRARPNRGQYQRHGGIFQRRGGIFQRYGFFGGTMMAIGGSSVYSRLGKAYRFLHEHVKLYREYTSGEVSACIPSSAKSLEIYCSIRPMETRIGNILGNKSKPYKINSSLSFGRNANLDPVSLSFGRITGARGSYTWEHKSITSRLTLGTERIAHFTSGVKAVAPGVAPGLCGLISLTLPDNGKSYMAFRNTGGSLNCHFNCGLLSNPVLMLTAIYGKNLWSIGVKSSADVINRRLDFDIAATACLTWANAALTYLCRKT